MYELFTIQNCVEYIRLATITPVTTINPYIEIIEFCDAHKDVYYRLVNDSTSRFICEDIKELYKSMKQNGIELKKDFNIRIDM